MIKRLDAGTCILVAAASLAFIWEGVWPLAGFDAVLAVGLIVGTLRDAERITLGFRLGLMSQLLLFGVVWPSALTIIAVVVSPALVVGIRNLVATRSPALAGTYVAATALVAACAVLSEALVLART